MEPADLSVFENVEMRMAVVDAVDELMQHTPFDRLSVSKICEASGVSRATFYRYFTDKFSIVQWFIKFIHSTTANEIGRTLSWFEGYYTSELIIANRRSFFGNAAKSNDYNALDNFIPRYRRQVLMDTLANWHHVDIDEHWRFMVRATVEVEIHLFPTWHYGKFDCPLDEFCHWVVDCVPTELFDLLDTPLNPRERGEGKPGGLVLPSATQAKAGVMLDPSGHLRPSKPPAR